jgi:hypothetical protein
MNRKVIGGLLALVVAVAAVWLFWLRHRGEQGAAATPAVSAKPTDRPPTTPTPAAGDQPDAPRGIAPKWTLDLDPIGSLPLEGQVLGPDGGGVPGAKVWLGSVPPRTTTTEGDGTFSFDKLVGRSYSLSASSGELVGGLEYKLTDKSPPAVIHLSEGATANISVVDEAQKPIAGATVHEGGDTGPTAKTDEQGKAVLKPVRPGWVSVEASAPGFATNSSFTTIGSGGATGQITITLRKGYAVAGTVLDDTGKPIAKARVNATAATWGFGTKSSESDIVTDDKGAFQIPALAAGTHTLTAVDGEHAPARSTPITIKDRPVTGIVITMKAGGLLAGTVVDIGGKPVPFATVQILGKGQQAWMTGPPRQATTDKLGAFEIRGLARSTLQTRAESETSASKVIDVDLTEKIAIKDLELVLDVSGQIAGTVVDDTGAPVPEVQVNAFPDILGGASTDGLALAGMSSATTDGGGAFVITGVPDGAYRLWAARSSGGMFQEWGQQGVPAKTGDKGVKIVLPAPGELVGKIVVGADGGKAPTFASVQVGQKPPTPASKGEFVIKDVTPGTYDVTFRGPEFTETTKRDVKIEPGKKTDLGTVVALRGRRLSGKVVDRSGQAVAGAKIRVGEMLFTSEGSEDQMSNMEEIYGIRSSMSDQAGEFVIIGVPTKGTTILADHTEKGRSIGVPVPEGSDDPPPMTLTLRGYGSVTGKVTMKGKPQPKVTVSVSSKGGGASAAFAETDDEGNYTMSKVPEGPQVIQAMKQSMMSMKTAMTNATVTAGKQSTVNIDIPVGTLTLGISISAAPNAKVDAAQVFLFAGLVAVATGKQLTDGFFQGGAQGMKFWLGKAMPMPEFDELVAGDYSVCSIPITGDLSDPKFQGRLQENIATLKVYCKAVKLTAAPAKQTVDQALPSMTPLPEPAP